MTALVSKTLPKSLGHISSLKHVKDVKLTPSSGSHRGAESNARDFQPGNDVRFQCPISGQPLNGQYRFCVLLPTGHIVSEKSVKQVSPWFPSNTYKSVMRMSSSIELQASCCTIVAICSVMLSTIRELHQQSRLAPVLLTARLSWLGHAVLCSCLRQ